MSKKIFILIIILSFNLFAGTFLVSENKTLKLDLSSQGESLLVFDEPALAMACQPQDLITFEGFATQSFAPIMLDEGKKDDFPFFPENPIQKYLKVIPKKEGEAFCGIKTEDQSYFLHINLKKEFKNPLVILKFKSLLNESSIMSRKIQIFVNFLKDPSENTGSIEVSNNKIFKEMAIYRLLSLQSTQDDDFIWVFESKFRKKINDKPLLKNIPLNKFYFSTWINNKDNDQLVIMSKSDLTLEELIQYLP